MPLHRPNEPTQGSVDAVDLPVLNVMDEVTRRAGIKQPSDNPSPMTVLPPESPAGPTHDAQPTQPALVTDSALQRARLLLSEQNSVEDTRLKFTKRVLMRASRLFTHRLVAAGQATTTAIETLEVTHGHALHQSMGLIAGAQLDLEGVHRRLDEIAAAQLQESRRRDIDTQALASQVTALESGQAKLRREQSRSTDSLHGQLTNIELGLEDAGIATTNLEDNVRGLAGQLSALERSSAHDRSEMHRTRTLLNRLVRSSAVGMGVTDDAASGSATAIPNLPPGSGTDLDDDTYLDFEHRFRGTRDEIRDRQKDAVPLVAGLAGASAPLLDLGCGRGEWLELARELKIPAYGVDSNASMVAEATRAGLDARVEDALGHLAHLQESTLQAVSAFHFVEHIPLSTLIEVLDSALVALRPGGTLLLETPNPTNLVVGAASFYLDPTHLRALHPDFLSFLVESRGFVDVKVHFVHPVIKEDVLREGHIDGLAESTRLSRLVEGVEWALFGPQDYLLTARRAEVAR